MKKLQNILFFVSTILVILSSGSVIGLKYGGVILLPTALLVNIFLIVLKGKIRLVDILLSTPLLALFIIHFVVFGNPSDSVFFIKFIFRCICAILWLSVYKLYDRDIIKDIYLVLKLFCLHAIVSYIVGINLHIPSLSLFKTEMLTTYSWHNIFFYQRRELYMGIELLRNQGLFWEAGVLGFFSIIFLYLSLLMYDKKKDSVIAAVVIVSTLSTTCFALMLVIIAYYFFTKRKLNRKVIVGALIILPFLVSLTYDNISDKFTDSNYSKNARLYDLNVGLMVFVNNPLGISFSSERYFEEQNDIFLKSYPDIEARTNSNSVIMLLYVFGIIAFIVFISIYFQNIVEKKNLFFVLIIILNMSSPLIFSVFVLLFIFTGFINLLGKFRFNNHLN